LFGIYEQDGLHPELKNRRQTLRGRNSAALDFKSIHHNSFRNRPLHKNAGPKEGKEILVSLSRNRLESEICAWSGRTKKKKNSKTGT